MISIIADASTAGLYACAPSPAGRTVGWVHGLVGAQTQAQRANRLVFTNDYLEMHMRHITHSARVITPMPYVALGGRTQKIPAGPVLIESMGKRSIDIVWGADGQNFVSLPIEVVETARDDGKLILLD